MSSSRRLIALTVAAAVVLPVAASGAKEPAAPATPAAVRAYHDSGEWAKDLKTAYAKATKDVTKALAKKGKKGKPTLVMDIDDTVLSTYECSTLTDFEKIGNAACVVNGGLPVIKPGLTLAKFAQKKKVKLVFITARPNAGDMAVRTKANLKAAGFSKYDLILKPFPDDRTSAQYKADARKTLIKSGARVILTIGDQQSDLSGGAAEYKVKLPNPMYVNK